MSVKLPTTPESTEQLGASGLSATYLMGGYPSVTIQLAGTFVATVTFETCSDGGTWRATGFIRLLDGSLVTTATAGGQFALPNSGILQVRARCSAYTSGTVQVSATGGLASPSAPGSGGGGGGGTSSTFGDAFPGTGTAAGFISATGTMAGATLDAAGFVKVNVAAGGAGGGAVTIADGDDVAEGAQADAAVLDASGSVNAHLRGLITIVADVWVSASHFLKVSIQNATVAVTQSGSWVLSAGSALIGKVGIDQTTPGTTNAVAVAQIGASTVTAGAGAVAAGTQRLTLASDDPAVVSLQILDDWDESDRAKVNPIVGQAGITGGAGAVGAATTRVAIATDANAVVASIAAAQTLATVTTVGTVSSVTAIAGALPAGNNNIGDVDVASSALPTGAATETSAAAILATAGATSGAAVITDANGTLQQYLRGVVKLAITAGGWLATVTGNVAHDAADAGNPIKIGSKAYAPDGTTPGTAVAEGDRSDAKADLDGRIYVNDYHPVQWRKNLNGSTAYTDEELKAAPGAGFQLIITSIQLSTGAATALNAFLKEGATKIWGPIYLEAVAGRGYVSGPIHLPITANTAVTLTTSASIAQSVDVLGFVQAV